MVARLLAFCSCRAEPSPRLAAPRRASPRLAEPCLAELHLGLPSFSAVHDQPICLRTSPALADSSQHDCPPLPRLRPSRTPRARSAGPPRAISALNPALQMG
ncbi:hypothetical protein AXF42_Ash004031 [Apostasia shenzhenica]|uniref:Uncharacterized protein n=1 Tax=Apostasia shenzhenica TaxID=1088818 RepID=A0A2I0A1R3_9ASPA|nr:hypothetical protein AXF42_Ash004031 [Apostasia shenzhenica]